MEGGFSEEKADELDTQLVSIAKSEYGLYRERTNRLFFRFLSCRNQYGGVASDQLANSG